MGAALTDSRCQFVRMDIRDPALAEVASGCDAAVHFAAESHVDRCINDPLAFVSTNVVGTAALLQTAREFWKNDLADKIFYHISTDEVYGSLGAEGFFTEQTPYDPRSPYSASKASSDHLVRAFYHTYHMPVKISN